MLNKSTQWMWFLILLAVSLPAVSQTNVNEDQGTKPYDSWSGGDLDSISMTNGGLVLHIPLASFPQRGNLDLGFFVSFSNKQWYIKPGRCCDALGHMITQSQWLPMPNTGVQIVSSTDWWLNTCTTIEPQDPNAPGQELDDWSDTVSSPDGSSHVFGNHIADFSGPVYPLRSLDASGLLRPNSTTLILPNGTRYSYSSTGSTCPSPFGGIRGGKQPSSVTDANGNQITISSSGWSDTVGRSIPGSASSAVQGTQPGVPTSDLSKCPAATSSALIWNVPGPANISGGIRTFYFCYSMFVLSTNFGSNSEGANNYGPTNTSLLSAVVLPDLTMWTFTYDNYGDVTHVGFPTGGSLSYAYGIGPLNAGTGTGFSTWVMSRTADANDGTGGHQWTYTYQGNFPTGTGTAIYSYGTKGIATTTSPDGNDVVYTVGPGTTGSGCPGYVYQTQYFQGSASSNVLLKTVQTQYSCTMGTPGGNLDGVALNTVPTQQTTVLAGGQTSRVVNTYDPLIAQGSEDQVMMGSLLQKDEYDFSNVLVRSTVNHYLWQDNSVYKSNNFLSLPVSSTLLDGAGTQVGKVAYAYDEYGAAGRPMSSGIVASSLVAPPAGEPIRGNLTTTSHWLDTTNSLLSATMTYFDTGMAASSTPPANSDGHNRTTTYTYSPTFLGAYITQTNLPDTQMPDPGATVIHHITTGNYDLNTGLLTSLIDENGQAYTYQYDALLRLAQATHPDGGQVTFSYPDPNTLERRRLIAASTYDDLKVKFDGLGRIYETQNTTPSGVVLTDTTYDVVGRVSSVSNPYYQGSSHGSDLTYGVTQNQYDALGRKIGTIKPDGSSSSVQYSAVAGDGAGANVICTTAIDEARKPRQSCFDALGRMAKVVEPNPGAIATNATGWATVSGAEQTANSQPATSGSATITISGSEQSTCAAFLRGRCVGTAWDTGTVTITANGHVDSYTYGHFDTASSVASNLAGNINSDSAASVNASASGTTITITARATGASTNYSFTTSSATSDTACNYFCGPSFFASPASGALTGGQNASSTPDTGTVTVTLNGTGYSTTFGSGDTSSSIASRLAAAIGGGSSANASASGGTITLTSKTPGTAGDYSLSTSYTWNNSQFTNPSFTTAASGSALTGALDAGAVNNNPYVTTYQYNARGDMLCVHQKATDTSPEIACAGASAPSVPLTWRQRFFVYDSLSRLVSITNPETNSTGTSTITYAYDNNNNLVSKITPAPNQAWGSASTITITQTYDALNRILDTSYSDGVTPTSSHRYDYASFLGQTLTYPIGRQVAILTANNTVAQFTSFDKMGRISTTTQCNPGNSGCKTFAATYSPVGRLLALAYPSGNFTVNYSYDAAGRLYDATDSNGVNYAHLDPTSSSAYLASGLIREFTAPNFNNLKYHVDYNNRLEPIEIWTGSGQGAGALFDKQYQYNPPNVSQMNNGNVYLATNIKDPTRTQTFAYDVLNRVVSGNDQVHWANSYVYDAWGNLQKVPVGTLPGENLQHAADGNNHLVGYSYDAAGDLLNDGLNNWTYVYDAQSRILNAGGMTYTYDAVGRRVQKSSGINYWYGPGGTVLAETDSGGTWTNYIFFGSQRLARNISGDIKYYITDHLHSTAMFVDKAGTAASVLDDNDFYPFGTVVPGVGQTTSNNTLKFAGQYRDTESNLDYVAARYYSSSLGRWTTADQPLAGQNPVNPQSWSLYSYALNSPLIHTDSTGSDVDKNVVQFALGQMAGLQPGDKFTVVYLGIHSGEPNYMSTPTAQAIPGLSDIESLNLGPLDTGAKGNAIVIPNANGVWPAFRGAGNQDQIDTGKVILDYALDKGLDVQAVAHSNGTVDLAANVQGLAPGTFSNVVVIAPNTGSVQTMNKIVNASENTAIVTSDNDSALAKAPFAHRSAEFWASTYADNPNVQVIQTNQSGHGVQYYSAELHALIVSPIGDGGRAQRLAGEAAYGQFLLMQWVANDLACIPCQVAPWMQDSFGW